MKDVKMEAILFLTGWDTLCKLKQPSFSIMAGSKIVVLEFLLQLFCLVSPEKQPDVLNVLSILLPYSTAGSANVNFTIRASDGCYKW